jgi:hypothetical protein
MGRPDITADQRELVVELLANALRKDSHLRNRVSPESGEHDPLRASLIRRRSEPSQRYIDGMLDLIRVMFPHGHTLAKECLEDAYALTMGLRPHGINGDPETPLH